ncbi:hypothetical protein hmeg3_16270 [Herbaspirillum sp. meg3]|uniref:4'-phosphopantetheinyl transferase family protein n=1 Tax=Herbaspirillum sp. meg3 TaxID=2025949 RepID=UPI000B985BDA|nr:4'-phosphopantetheinyl transferase superfamily protein [Herbaspirillum sp. meg3]ASU39683.1 hypothetical protein hmeg3_16270 [Herbaspirillum sp. meg3]
MPTNKIAPIFPASTSAATLWLLHGDLVSEARLASLAASLGQSERKRYGRFLRPQRAREFLLGRMLLRHAVQTMLGIAASDIIVTEREGNAPLLEFPAPYTSSDFHFSLSHSHGWIGCLASTVCAVGLDIENKAHARDVDQLSAAAFDEADQQWLMRLEMARRQVGFYRLWNNREALYKLRGNRTITTDLRSCDTGWNCFHVDYPRLHIGVCVAQELQSFELVELAELNPVG